VIEVEGVSKYYGPTRGVENISFRVARGEILGLLGPNGAGKTTTIRMITGYMPPSEGRIRIDGFDLDEDPYEARRRIGYLPDNPPLYPEMTVRAYLAFMAELRGVPRPRRRERVDAVIEAMELQAVAGRLIGHLSRGFRQRVGLAQALVHEPPALVLDEPTVGLDPRQIAEMRELIRRLGSDRAVVLSSHILPEVQAICHRVIILHRGQVLAEDDTQRLGATVRGTRRLALRVARDPQRAATVLAGVPGVTQVVPGEEGLFYVHSQPEQDVREALFFALADAGLPLVELRPADVSLEEVFLQLTTDEGGTAA
jgi:ABC-2 type transport system ATP-binding protein